MTEFRNLRTTLVGDIAEDFIYAWLLTGQTVKMEYVYANYPIKSHPFDFYCLSADTENTKFLGDVKVKYPTYEGLMSIHLNDLKKYMKWAKKENCTFLLFYINYKTGDINATTPQNILKSEVKRVQDDDKKWILYFNRWKKIGTVPQEICYKMKAV